MGSIKAKFNANEHCFNKVFVSMPLEFFDMIFLLRISPEVEMNNYFKRVKSLWSNVYNQEAFRYYMFLQIRKEWELSYLDNFSKKR